VMAKIKKYYRCDECDKIKGVCRCERPRFTIYIGEPDQKEIPDNLAVENFMYTAPVAVKEEKSDDAKMILVKFVKNNVKDLMISNNDPTKVYVRIDTSNHIEFYNLMGTKFTHWLKDKSFTVHEKVFSEDAFNSAISLVYAQAQMKIDVKRVNTYLRVAQTPEAIFYDLCSDQHEVVKITPGNIEIKQQQKDFPVFIHSNRCIPQIKPDLKTYDQALDSFIKILSIEDDERFLFKIHLISLFLEGVPIPIIDLFAEQGKGKSVITATIKRIVDPQSTTIKENVNKMPVREESYMLECASKYLIAWDNISNITASQSDDICRMVTGGASEKRKLFTDDDLIVMYLRREFVINGIGVNLHRGDYLERSINYNLKFIEKRLTEQEYEDKINDLLPRILGDIFHTLSRAMQFYPRIKDSFEELPRMADFAIWGEAISQSLNEKPGVFLKQYQNMMSNTIAVAGANHALVKYVEYVMGDKEAYNESISNFYKSMKVWAELEGYDMKSKYTNFPRSVQAIRTNLERVDGFIRESGYHVNISDRNYSRNQKGSRGAVYITISHLMEKEDKGVNTAKPNVPECQSVPGTNIDTDTLINTNELESANNDIKTGVNEPLTPRHAGTQNTTKLTDNTRKTFRCQNCNTTWRKVTNSLNEIQEQHGIKNENHMIIEVMGE